MNEWLGADTVRKMLQINTGLIPDQVFPSPSRDYIPPKLSYILRKMANEADKYKDRLTLGMKDDDVEIGQPNRAYSARNYFARFITKRMVEMTGNPQRKLALPLIQTLFDDDTEQFGESQLSRIAPVTEEMQEQSENFRKSLREQYDLDKYSRIMGLNNPLKPDIDE